MNDAASEPLSGEDLAFWLGDQPRQRTTMAMLLLLDRRPHSDQLRAAAWRAVEAVPRLQQRVVDAPLDLARPRWRDDPTFDIDFHIRRYAVSHEDGATEHATLDDLFRTLGPIYERPFDRTRPLWELIELDGPGEGAAIFFRLHHAVADGVGGNAILAALTDPSRDAPVQLPRDRTPGPWEETPLADELRDALRHRLDEARERQRALWRGAWTAFTRPSSLVTAARIVGGVLEDALDTTSSPLEAFGRSRHLSGIDLPFEPLRSARDALGGKMIDVLLTAVAGAVGDWHRAHGHGDVSDIRTLVPINLRARADQGLGAATGNRATGVSVKLPIGERDVRARFREIHRRMEERKAHPAVEYLPQLSEGLAVLPRPLFRALALSSSQSVNLIVTNVPGIMQPRYLAGAQITAGYPFAPTAPQCPVSVALYGYDGHLYVGIDADGTGMPDLDAFRASLASAFDEVIAAGAERRTA